MLACQPLARALIWFGYTVALAEAGPVAVVCIVADQHNLTVKETVRAFLGLTTLPLVGVGVCVAEIDALPDRLFTPAQRDILKAVLAARPADEYSDGYVRKVVRRAIDHFPGRK
jgi:hypothetical protein